jgi:hypothetical protein
MTWQKMEGRKTEAQDELSALHIMHATPCCLVTLLLVEPCERCKLTVTAIVLTSDLECVSLFPR